MNDNNIPTKYNIDTPPDVLGFEFSCDTPSGMPEEPRNLRADFPAGTPDEPRMIRADTPTGTPEEPW